MGRLAGWGRSSSRESRRGSLFIRASFHVTTRRHLKRGVFRSIVELQAAINRFIEAHNDDPKPFVWTVDLALPHQR